MDRAERAAAYHARGFNCSQAVMAAFSDLIGIDEQAALSLGAGFGAGAGTGELCGALDGGIIVLGLLTPVDMDDPVGSKQRTVALSKDLQRRFSERYGALRCRDLLANKNKTNESSPAARRLGLTKHCDLMIVSAVELVEEILAQRG